MSYVHGLQMSSSDRALINSFREINGMADRINLPKTIVDRANNLFKQVQSTLFFFSQNDVYPP